MKSLYFSLLLFPLLGFSQNTNSISPDVTNTNSLVRAADNLTLHTAFKFVNQVFKTATTLNAKVAVAVLDASGTIIILVRADGVGPHNIEAARRKAYTALSTGTNTLLLTRNAEKNPDTRNLNSLPELLLLSGGTPIFYKGNVIGSIGVAGGGSPENDDFLAKSAVEIEASLTIQK